MTKDVPSPKYQKPNDRKLQDIEAGRRVTRYYNCIQCHNIEDQGGYVLAKFDDPSLGPPILPASQGAKVQEQWLYRFLKGPTPIRPWLKIRMPTFSLADSEISMVTKYFLAKSGKELVIRDYSAIPVDEKLISPGAKLFKNYQCGKCHPSGPVTLGGETSASDLAPNLMQAHERLKPEWIIDWLHDPQKLQPGTRMPAFFFDGKGPDGTVFGGDADQQIKALEAYVWNLGRKGRVLSSGQ
jgi:mono/diheme cytochrome c family protein